ncbi:MAG TPA: hypothetical protein VI248_18290 [Kineosporiaceae bacterium]
MAPAVVALAAGVAGTAGWVIAGSPQDGAGTVPPACPATLPATPLAAGRGGVGDRLVPVPLPQPRGPVAVRICGYPAAAAGARLHRSAVLDPPRTAELAGIMNTPARSEEVPGGGRPVDCPDAGPVTLLLFRYTQGPPLVAEVDAGSCGLVSTSARTERGRADVVQIVAGSLA